MNKHLIAAFLVAASGVAMVPVFGSGYGPANHYDPIAGAPASQRGLSNLTIATDQAATDYGRRAFGGISDTTSQSGTRLAGQDHFSTYTRH